MGPTTKPTVVGFAPLALASASEDDEPTTLHPMRLVALRDTIPVMQAVAAAPLPSTDVVPPPLPPPAPDETPLYAEERGPTYLFLPPAGPARRSREAWLLHVGSFVGAVAVAALLLGALVEATARSAPAPAPRVPAAPPPSSSSSPSSPSSLPSLDAPARAEVVGARPMVLAAAGAKSRVARYLVEEGARVAVGEPLAELARDPLDDALTSAELSLRAAQATHRAAAARARQLVRAYRETRREARGRGAHDDDDDEDGDTDRSVRDAHDAADAAVADERRAAIAVVAARRDVAQAKTARSATVLRAPVAGVVHKLLVAVGSPTEPATPLVELAPVER